MVTAALLILSLVAPPVSQFTLLPDPPVAGRTLTITLAEGLAGVAISLSDPLGRWRTELPLADGNRAKVELPGNLPLLMIGLRRGEGVELPHRIWVVYNVDGKPQPGSPFWKAYLLAGFPAPFPPEGSDVVEALRDAEAALERDPGNPVVKDLVWRLRGDAAADKSQFLWQVDRELEGSPSGRLALAAVHLHQQLGDAAGANAISNYYKELISRARDEESERWSDIVSTHDPRERLDMLHRLIEDDPFCDLVPQCFQILSATYSALGDHRSTALYGLLSLRVTPGDAMILNGVAFAMAEGGFELERGLRLVQQAIEILNQPGRLTKPPQLSDTRWREELRHARAACRDTKGWLLTKQGRWEEARRAFDEATRLERNDEFYLHLGLMLMESGKKEEAESALREGLKLGGHHRRELESALDRLQS